MKSVTYTGPADEEITSDAFQIEVGDETHVFERGIPKDVDDAVAKACADYPEFNFDVSAAEGESDARTVPQLKEAAEQLGVDLTGKSKRDEILEAVQAAEAEKAGS